MFRPCSAIIRLIKKMVLIKVHSFAIPMGSHVLQVRTPCLRDRFVRQGLELHRYNKHINNKFILDPVGFETKFHRFQLVCVIFSVSVIVSALTPNVTICHYTLPEISEIPFLTVKFFQCHEFRRFQEQHLRQCHVSMAA